MTFDEAMQTLRDLGTAQNVKTYRRHGSGDNVFGVSFANLEKLRKKIKVDHELAMQMWATENTDARLLALMIADPEQITAKLADDWLKAEHWRMLACYVAQAVSRSPVALKCLAKWTKQKAEATRTIGYSLLASVLKDRVELLTDEDCRARLKTIEAEIHSSPNDARHAMNNAVIAIGVFKPALCDEAVETARRIGKVEVDHGDTSCKTPDAAAYILKSVSRSSPRRARC